MFLKISDFGPSGLWISDFGHSGPWIPDFELIYLFLLQTRMLTTWENKVLYLVLQVFFSNIFIRDKSVVHGVKRF